MFYFILLIHKLHTEILRQASTDYCCPEKLYMLQTFGKSGKSKVIHNNLLKSSLFTDSFFHTGLQKELACRLIFMSQITDSPESVKRKVRSADVLIKIYLRIISLQIFIIH